MTNKKVSVILTSYNHAKYLRESIDSVLNQTFPDFELIIWDDASTDESWKIIASYTDSRIRAFRNAINTGGGNINRAIVEQATGEYIAIHHSDDIWLPQKLEKQANFLDSTPQVGAVFCNAAIINEHGDAFDDKTHYYYNIFDQPNRSRYEWLNHFFYNGNALCHPSVLIRRKCYDDCGLYRDGLNQTDDLDMWVRLCLKYDIHILPEKLVGFRMRSSELNVSGDRPETHIRGQFEFLQIYSNYLSINDRDIFLQIFPDADVFFEKDDFDIHFALAMMSLKSPHPFGKLFGMQLLFSLINDPERGPKIGQVYGFHHNEFIDLTAGHDVFSVVALPDLQYQLAARNTELYNITTSRAWRVTMWLRHAWGFIFPSGTWQAKLISRIFSLMSFFIRNLLPQLNNKIQSTRHLFNRGWHALRNEGMRVAIAKGVRIVKQFLLRRRRLAVIPYLFESSSSHDTDTYVQQSAENLQVKVVAFYLPQFHPIPENDVWWGKGFTEWTNVRKAVPNFTSHYQPHQPDELGYYDLRTPEIQQRQVELARKYGIHGFCFYYYWFKGKRLLERPIDQYLANPRLDLPFCLCWANENWTRRWDGAEHEILIAQEYTEEQYLHFIQDISKHFLDPRYIRVDGKPMLLVYRVNLLPDPLKAVEVWRSECQKMGIGEIYLVAVQSFGITDPRPFGFDAAVEFPPSNLFEAEVSRESVKVTNSNFKGRIFDYNLASNIMAEKKHGDYTVFKTAMPSWDNTARRQNASHIFINASPSAYKKWLEKIVAYSKKTLPKDKRFVFVNAWNEWAEGTHLEPDRQYGYAYLKATAEAITKKTAGSDWTLLFISHDANRGGAQEVLINVISWYKKYTNLNIKVLCLQGGNWLHRFEEIADTALLEEFGEPGNEDRLLEGIRQFCDGTPDLIYGNTVASGKVYAWLHQLGSPILTHFHELETSIRKYGSSWIQDVIKYSSHFIACSNAVQKNLVINHDVPSEKISTIHASIVSKQANILDDKTKGRVRGKFGLEQNRTIIFGCGIGMPFRKGADIFIKLGEQLLDMGYKNFHLYWIGDFDPAYKDNEHGSWKSHYSKLKVQGLNKHVTFLGLKENPTEYLSCGDIFVLPSREDPFPLVALEAADCGLPIVCFDKAGGMSDFVENDAGCIVPYEDIQAMAQTLIELSEQKEFRQKLGRQAKEKLLEGFTMERTTPHILSTGRKIAGRQPAISVIVPNYNHAKFLHQRLESIFKQTFRDFEIILLDDASSDNSLEIMEEYANCSDVTIIRNDENSGSPFKQWIKGLGLARAEIIWIAESDDISDHRFLETLLPSFANPLVKLAFVNSHVIDDNGHVVGDYSSTEYLTSLSQNKWNNNYLVDANQEINDGLGIKNTILNVSAALFRKPDLSEQLRDVLSKMRIAGDWLFEVKTILGGKIYYNATKLNYHRRHSNSVIGKTISENKLRDFFDEYFEVQSYIFENSRLSADFENRWEDYLRSLWYDFAPGKDFVEISKYYPLELARKKIRDSFNEGNI